MEDGVGGSQLLKFGLGLITSPTQPNPTQPNPTQPNPVITTIGKDASHADAIALNNAHDAEKAAWKAFMATKIIRDHAILEASSAFKSWQAAREHQKSLGGECS
jgi:hypothetical protein